MPSPSTISVSVRLHSSSRRCRSALERASLETSRPNTAPTSPQHTRPTSSLNPLRADPPRIAVGTAVLTDTQDGDGGAVEDGDRGGERPNDQRGGVLCVAR